MTTAQIKISVYSLVTAILAGFFGYFLNAAINDANSFWLPLVLGLFFLALFILQNLFIKDFWIFAIAGIQSLILGISSQVAIPGLMACIFFILWAAWRAKDLIAQGLKIDLRIVNRTTTPIAITALSVLIAFLYTPTLITKDLTISQPVIVSIFGPSLPFLNSYIPGLSLDMSVRDALKAASGSLLPREMRTLPIEQRDAVIAQSEGQLLQSLSDSLGVKVHARDSLLTVISSALNFQLSKIPKEYVQYIDISLGLLVFLTIKSFGFIFSYVIYLLALLIYTLLRLTNFISITTEKIDKEVVVV